MKISPSSLNIFLQCQLRWYFWKNNFPEIYIDDTPRRIGTMIHHVIYSYFMSLTDVPSSEEEIEKLIRKTYENCFDVSLWRFKKECDSILKNFIEFEKYRFRTWDEYVPELIEHRFTINDYLTGIVDFYGNRIVIDWKTGKNTTITLENKRQGNIYRYMLEAAGYGVDKIFFVYLRNNKIVEIKYDRGWIESEIRKMIRQIEEGIFRPSPGFYCSFCPYIVACQFIRKGVCSWMI